MQFFLAVASSYRRFAWIGEVLRVVPSLFVAVPVFWLGIMLIHVFSFQFGWVEVISPGLVEGLIVPALTMAGVLFGELIGGAVVTETVLGRAGIGRLTEQAVSNQDTPVLQAVVLLAALIFVVSNLILDLVYPLLDPRLRARG